MLASPDPVSGSDIGRYEGDWRVSSLESKLFGIRKGDIAAILIKGACKWDTLMQRLLLRPKAMVLIRQYGRRTGNVIRKRRHLLCEGRVVVPSETRYTYVVLISEILDIRNLWRKERD
jgi:hypothetical protein